jgi:hypothetical protein
MMPMIEFVKPYGSYRVGERINPPASLRTYLVRFGFARSVVADPPVLECAAMAQPETAAMPRPQRRRRA